MKKMLVSLAALAMLCACSSGGGSAATELTGEGTGMNGAVKVKVTLENDKITAVEVTEHAETEGICEPAIEKVPAAIVEKNGTDGVEVVSGATMTSNAIIEAVNNALASKD